MQHLSPAAAQRPFAGKLLIADRGNNRLLVLNPSGNVTWTYPSPKLPAPPVPFYFPDDAFWVHGGHAILVNEEENDVLAEIAYPSGKTLWTYGHPRVGGSAPGYTHQPDDLYPYPGGGLVVADAKNCRVLFFDPAGHPSGQVGSNRELHSRAAEDGRLPERRDPDAERRPPRLGDQRSATSVACAPTRRSTGRRPCPASTRPRIRNR